MIGLLVQLVILLLVLGIIFWICRVIVTALGLPPIVLTLVEVLLALILLVWLLGVIGMLPAATWRWRPYP